MGTVWQLVQGGQLCHFHESEGPVLSLRLALSKQKTEAKASMAREQRGSLLHHHQHSKATCAPSPMLTFGQGSEGQVQRRGPCAHPASFPKSAPPTSVSRALSGSWSETELGGAQPEKCSTPCTHSKYSSGPGWARLGRRAILRQRHHPLQILHLHFIRKLHTGPRKQSPTLAVEQCEAATQQQVVVMLWGPSCTQAGWGAPRQTPWTGASEDGPAQADWGLRGSLPEVL